MGKFIKIITTDGEIHLSRVNQHCVFDLEVFSREFNEDDNRVLTLEYNLFLNNEEASELIKALTELSSITKKRKRKK